MADKYSNDDPQNFPTVFSLDTQLNEPTHKNSIKVPKNC